MNWLCLGNPDWDEHPEFIDDAAKHKPIGIFPPEFMGLGAALTVMPRAAEARGGESSTFQATGLDHVALNVRSVPRSREIYIKHSAASISSAIRPRVTGRAGASGCRGRRAERLSRGSRRGR